MVEDHFAILKVGPWLTFAFREAVLALSAIERELFATTSERQISHVREALEAAMLRDPAIGDLTITAMKTRCAATSYTATAIAADTIGTSLRSRKRSLDYSTILARDRFLLPSSASICPWNTKQSGEENCRLSRTDDSVSHSPSSACVR